ncbi:MAG: hypothetical protein F4226_06590 [Synechococcus sp. SB0678_bin_12]|nr:hypothetical protein [Synechococcus sp. SB0678_bin_12]MYI87291.1 hypothetical protein [Synechococcus sp. SB0672_bin_10]
MATFAGAASTAAESAGTPNATVNLSPALPPNITLRYTDNSAAGNDEIIMRPAWCFRPPR